MGFTHENVTHAAIHIDRKDSSVGVLDIFLNFNKGSTILDFAKIFCCHLSPVFIMWARIGEMLKLAYSAYQFFLKIRHYH